jgi:inorganic triphosphatase YgiF
VTTLEFPAGSNRRADMADHLEIEQKFDVEAGFTLPDLSAVPGCQAVSAPEIHQLSATYYDTPGNRLAASKITLRRRTGGTDEGWHLKLPSDRLPSGAQSRREIHAPLAAGPEGQVPAQLADLVAEVTAGLPLSPIASLMTRRTIRTLLRGPSDLLAEVADDQVTARREGSAGEPLRWREVEVEVPEGTPPEVLAVAAELLLAAGARPGSKGSKLARVLDS